MPWQRQEEVLTRCYPSGKSAALRIAGFVLIGIGVLLILFCVPFWAWIAVLGAGLILLGFILIRK